MNFNNGMLITSFKIVAHKDTHELQQLKVTIVHNENNIII